jgi:hypothetical protein
VRSCPQVGVTEGTSAARRTMAKSVDLVDQVHPFPAFLRKCHDEEFPDNSYALIRNTSTRFPLLRDVKNQMPQAMCEMGPVGLNRNLLVNRDVPPFENPDLRHAVALSLHRQAFIDILTEDEGDIGGVMQPAPAGLWGMARDVCKHCRATVPTLTKTARAPARSCANSAMGPITCLRSRYRCAISHTCETRHLSSSTS